MKTDLDALMTFVERQKAAGKLSSNTAQSYTSSIQRVFEVAKAAELGDVLAADLEALFGRFRETNRGLGENTLTSYEGRVRAAITKFRENVDGLGEQLPVQAPLSIPLRDSVVRIEGLPSDLTEAEARRIAAVIVAMAS